MVYLVDVKHDIAEIAELEYEGIAGFVVQADTEEQARYEGIFACQNYLVEKYLRRTGEHRAPMSFHPDNWVVRTEHVSGLKPVEGFVSRSDTCPCGAWLYSNFYCPVCGRISSEQDGVAMFKSVRKLCQFLPGVRGQKVERYWYTDEEGQRNQVCNATAQKGDEEFLVNWEWKAFSLIVAFGLAAWGDLYEEHMHMEALWGNVRNIFARGWMIPDAPLPPLHQGK